MTPPVRVIVTGSRAFSNPECVKAAMAAVRERYRGRRVILVHGECPPRHRYQRNPRRPETLKVIPWQSAMCLRPADRWALLGADWLCALAAAELGWRVEGIPANWNLYGSAAGPERNKVMVARGGDEGNVFLSGGLRNRGTMDCAVRMLHVGIPLTVWCAECGPRPLSAPCVEHCIDGVRAQWRKALAASTPTLW